jgi:hypothetical protein
MVPPVPSELFLLLAGTLQWSLMTIQIKNIALVKRRIGQASNNLLSWFAIPKLIAQTLIPMA